MKLSIELIKEFLEDVSLDVNDVDSTSDYSSFSSSPTSDEDFDAFWAASEKYIGKFIAMMKKAKTGVCSAMQTLPL